MWKISSLTKNTTQNFAENKKRIKSSKVYHYVSLNSLIDSHFDRYTISCMAYLKVMVPNNVLEEPKFEIVYTNYASIKIQEKVLIQFDQRLEKCFLRHTLRNFAVYKNQEKWIHCTDYEISSWNQN